VRNRADDRRPRPVGDRRLEELEQLERAAAEADQRHPQPRVRRRHRLLGAAALQRDGEREPLAAEGVAVEVAGALDVGHAETVVVDSCHVNQMVVW
jgi:hypothetical protein